MSQTDDTTAHEERPEAASTPGTAGAGGDVPRSGDGIAIGADDEADTFEPEEPSE
jgi:hypothetical protein